MLLNHPGINVWELGRSKNAAQPKRNSGNESVGSYNTITGPRKINYKSGSVKSYESQGGHLLKSVRPKSNVFLDDNIPAQKKTLQLEEAILKNDPTAVKTRGGELFNELVTAGADSNEVNKRMNQILSNQPGEYDEGFQILLKKATRDRMYNWIKLGSRQIQGNDNINSNQSVRSGGGSTSSSISQAEITQNKSKVRAFDDALDNMKIQIAQSAVNSTNVDNTTAAQITLPVVNALQQLTTNNDAINETKNVLVQIINATPRGEDFKDSNVLDQKEAVIENLLAKIPPVELADDGTATVIYEIRSDVEDEKREAPHLGIEPNVDDDGDSILDSSESGTAITDINYIDKLPISSSNPPLFPQRTSRTVISNPARSVIGNTATGNYNNSQELQLRQQITSLNNQVTLLQNQQQATLENYNKAMGELTNAMDKADGLQEQLNNSELNYQNLVKENQIILKNAMKQSDTEYKQAERRAKLAQEAAEQQMKALSAQVHAADLERDNAQVLVNSLSSENSEKTSQVSQLNLNISNLNSQIALLQGQVKTSQSQQASLQRALDTSESKKNTLQDELNTAKQSITDIQSQQAAAIKTALNELTTTLTQQNQQNVNELSAKLKQSQGELNQEKIKYENEKTEYKRKINELTLKISELTSNLSLNSSGTSSQITLLQEQKSYAESEVTRLTQQIESLTKQQSESNKNALQQELDMGILKNQVKNLTNQVTQSKQDLDQMQEQKTKMEGAAQKLREKINELETKQLTDGSNHQKEINGLKSQITNIGNELDTKKQEISTAQRTITRLENEKTQADEEIGKLQSTIQELRKKQQEDQFTHENAINTLNSNVTGLQKKLTNSTDAKQQEIRDLEEQKTKANAKADKLQEQINELKAEQDQEIKKMMNKNASLKSEFDVLANEKRDLADKWKAAEAKHTQNILEKEMIIEQLNTKIKLLENRIKQLETEQTNLETAKKDVTDLLNRANDEVKKQSISLTEVHNQLTSLATQDKTHLSEIKNLQQEIELKEREIENANKTISGISSTKGVNEQALREQISQLGTAKTKAELDIIRISGLNDQLRIDFNSQENRFNQLDAAKQKLDIQVASLERTLRDLEANGITQEELERSKTAITQLEYLMEQKEKEISSLKNQIQFANQTIGFRETEINRLNKELANLSSPVPMDVDNNAEQIRKLNEQLTTARAELNNLQTDNFNLHSENLNLQSSIASSSGSVAVIDSLKKQINNLKSELTTTRDELTTLKRSSRAAAASVVPSSSSSLLSYLSSRSVRGDSASVKQFLAVIASAY
jgi:chromosome segregation ATPase